MGLPPLTDPATWCDFDAAVAQRHGHDGIGIVIGPPYVGIDLDKCRNPETGAIAPWAQRIIEEVNSYTKISPTGTGAHIWVKGELPCNGGKKGQVEMYKAGRYFTVTGQHLEGTPLTIERRDLLSLYERMKSGEFDFTRQKKSGPAPPTRQGSLIVHDRFDRLVAGQWAGLYPSASEADLALCVMLANKTNCDHDAIDRGFRKSGLMRDKWESHRRGSTYGHQTIAKAIRLVRESTVSGAEWSSRLIFGPGARGVPRPKAILENAIVALRHAPEWEGVLGYNEFSLYVVTLKPAPWGGAANKN